MIVHLDQIVIDAGTQARTCINSEVVAEYAERMTEGDKFPPVVLFHDGNNYYIGDGFHRVLAAERNTMDRIEAEVRKGTREDALWFALGANKTNGQRMTRGDIRHAVEVALQTWPEKTQQEIAEQIGCHQSTVQRAKDELMQTHKFAIPETRVGRDGKERPTTYARREPEPESDTPEFIEPEEGDMTSKPHMTKKELDNTPPARGMHLARLAVMDLEQITEDDRERQDAFDYVKGWINDREN